MAILTLVFGREILGTHAIEKGKIIIGRGEDADIIIANLAVSRHHATIEKKDDLFSLKDLGSNNGTFLNGQRIMAPTNLKYGDEIGIGKHVLVFDKDSRKPRGAAASATHDSKPSQDAPEMGTMFVEPAKMEKIREKATAARRAHLKLVGAADTQVIPIDKTDTVFGKGENCDVKIQGFFASRRHAMLSRLENGYHLTNYAGFSPTKVNGIRVESALLVDGDELTMGRTRFVFHSEQ